MIERIFQHLTFKRYFYSNNITGENSWAYPEVVVVLDTPVNQHEAEATVAPYRDVLIEAYHNAASQVIEGATDGALLMHMREPSEAGSDNALPIPSDLLTWAANPPPPPPATPPQPPSPSQNSEPFSTSEMDFDNTALDDQSINPSTENGMDATQIDQSTSPGEPVLPVTEPVLPAGQISAPPMITKSVVQPLASAHKDGVGNVTLSVVSPDGSAAAVLPGPGGVVQEGPYDGEPMEDAAAGSHPVKEKKKKKEKSLLGGGLAMKKKNVSSLVEKWQKIQVDFSKEDEKEINRQMKLAELAAKASSASLKTD